jgi:hypothetical protein
VQSHWCDSWFIRKSGYFFTGGWNPQVIEDQVTYPLFLIYREFLKSKYPGFFDVWDEFYLHHFWR